MIDRREQNTVLNDCAERLERLGIAYFLTGSMALPFYGLARLTADIDIVIVVDADDADKIIKAFEPDYYVPHNTVKSAIARRSMFNVLHQEAVLKIDFIVFKNDEFQQSVFSRRQKVRYAENSEIWLISREDLILSKLNWSVITNSEMQLRDVAAILRHDYDVEYVKFWVAKLNLEHLLNQVLEDLENRYAPRHDT